MPNTRSWAWCSAAERWSAAGRTVAATAARWGFLDPARFSRVFKAAHGMSPGDYRAAHLAQGQSSR
ncbi:helix-turn-helix domain-containing protein [Streptomyces morookaense]|uniref:helix-turn-helix domain-containing protein n=1 Tax=Streptomyces morookaense TaxID=1970 RepID=UPI0033E943C8